MVDIADHFIFNLIENVRIVGPIYKLELLDVRKLISHLVFNKHQALSTFKLTYRAVIRSSIDRLLLIQCQD